MYNYFMLIGYVTSEINTKETKVGTVVNLALRVRRDFKNPDGRYSWDVINVSLWENMANIALDKIKKGSKVIVKGRVKPSKVTLNSGAVVFMNDLFADRLITFTDFENDVDEYLSDDDPDA